MRPNDDHDTSRIMNNVFQSEQYDEEEDELGYYEDGTKRTLTDEQIAIFRHSELEALRRAQELAASRGAEGPMPLERSGTENSPRSRDSVPPSEKPSHPDPSTGAKKRKKRKGKSRAQTEKPDLRKRTWDVVEAGLGALDYGDEAQDGSSVARQETRRRVSYDD